MEAHLAKAKFKYTWRSYQQVALDKLETAIKDKHFHIIAPPGSGKTVLGLETMIRLSKPTLILSPTLTIRDQWISRFCELFLNTAEIPTWISTDIRNPQFITIITYQGLHSACSTDDDLHKIVFKLKEKEVQTFILDEAHHLKNQWWMTLDKVKKAIDPCIIGLTATPPYDSTYTEWQRYLDMNGEIDLEISVPELIKDGDLCPHQDSVYFSQPTVEEFKQITKYRENITQVFNEYSRSEILISTFQQTAIWLNPEENLEWIYENLRIYTSYLLLLWHSKIEIPATHLSILGFGEEDKEISIPELSYDRLELLLNFFLFQDKTFFTELLVEKENIINQLRKKGAIERNIVKLTYNSTINRLLTASNSKLNSITQIVNFEYASLKDRLRLVILSDYIREEYLTTPKESGSGFRKMGVIPIFKTLLEANIPTSKIGVLTGSLVILPKSSLALFEKLCTEKGIAESEKQYNFYQNKYIIINNGSAIKDSIVDITTQLFTAGEIEILIGTKSLLGEGWDAPAINSLILASFVGSFVLSNQMRGRAIRVQKDNPTKTGNIWHLVCIDPTAKEGGQDLDTLERRFSTFVGISNTDDVYIENGLDRLNVKRDMYTEDRILLLNESTLAIARDRESLAEKWHRAITEGTSIINEIKVPYPRSEAPYEQTMKLYYTNTIKYLVADLLMVLLIFGYDTVCDFFLSGRFLSPLKDKSYYLIFVGIMGLAFFGRQTYKTFRTYVKYRDISEDFENIAKVLLKGLIKQGAIKTPEADLRVDSSIYKDGAVACFLKGGTRGEQTIFIRSLKEVLSIVDNPRYIIIRKCSKWKIRKDDYHSVPNLLGTNKELASYFQKTWSSLVGKSELVYTRTIDGRKLLLKARIESLSAQFEEEQQPEEYRKWA